ncbi:putative MFS hexose transporter [Aspergillus pseudoustus]|uniref:MFS hexose transporter n=1 Tax=Aspergillus pseudoustus TaxID=1810923 RepID=A0ABR4JLW4_9EURO
MPLSTSEQERIQQLIADAPPWYKCPNLIKLYLLLIAPLMTSTSWGFDNSMTNGLQSIDRFMDTFGHPTGARLGFFGASMSVGGIAACLVAGPLADRFGRRPLCSAGAAIVAGMAIMETFSTSFEMFTGGKVLLGFGAFLQQVAAPMLVTELAHPKQRVAISSLYNTSIFIGLLVGAWTTFATYRMESQWSWKLPCILQVIIPAYQTVMIWLVPESPRWLVSKGRVEEARKMLVKWHGNGIEDDIVTFEMQEIVNGVEADKTVMKLSWEGVKTTVGSKANRYRLWLCMWTAVGSQTIGGGFTASYLPMILDQIGMKTEKEQTLINGCISLFNWVCAFAAAFVIPRVGRRTIFLFSTGGTNVTFIIWTILTRRYIATEHVGLGIGVLVMIVVGSFMTVLCWIPLVIAYPLETVTTKQRGVYFAITMFTINVTAFFTTYVTPIGLGNIGWRYYLPTCVWNFILFLVIYFTYVETTGLTLEEIAVLFDGRGEASDRADKGKELDEKRQSVCSHVEVAVSETSKSAEV